MSVQTIDTDILTMLYEASILYYDHGYSQKQIGLKLGVSRPGVSRMLQKAREQGIVKIQIIDPTDNGTTIEVMLKKKFDLKKVIVVPYEDSSSLSLLDQLGRAASKYLDSVVRPGMIIGVSWGRTMKAVADHLTGFSSEKISIVQLTGALTRAAYHTYASEIVQKLARKYHSVPYMLPLPAVVESGDIRSVMSSDRHIRKTLSLSRDSSIVLFTIGSFGMNSALVKAHYFNRNEVETLINAGAAADICSRIINRQGQICSWDLNHRNIGIELEELRKKEYSIAVAGGGEKYNSILAALTGKWFNILITDETTATQLLTEEL